jgi:UDP-N-acetylglucosamine 2-epimerase (non-hydrolysing)
MLGQVLAAFGVAPDCDLSVMKEEQTLFDITEKVLGGMRDILERSRPDIVLVHGDTTTTLAAAWPASTWEYRSGTSRPACHVQHTLSYPEEFNRQAVDIVCEFLFAPTEVSRANLLKEGKAPETVFVTGNTAIDALKTTVRADYSHPELDWAAGSRLVTLTAHRRENLGAPMRRIFGAIRRIVEEFPDIKVVYPVHLNPAVREAARDVLGGCERVRLIEPLDVLDFHNFLARSHLILTDSGGIQEEAPSLGKPVLVLRDTTERPEGVEAGPLKLTGTDEETIYREFKTLLTDRSAYDAMSKASNPYGDGFASKRIADILEEKL